MHCGYSFLWLNAKHTGGKNHVPCFVTPSMMIVPMDVLEYIPYVCEEGLWTHRRDPAELATLTGVELTRRRIRIAAFKGKQNPVLAPAPNLERSSVALPTQGTNSKKLDFLIICRGGRNNRAMQGCKFAGSYSSRHQNGNGS